MEHSSTHTNTSPSEAWCWTAFAIPSAGTLAKQFMPMAQNQKLCCPHTQHWAYLTPLHTAGPSKHHRDLAGDLFTHHCCSEPRATAWHPRAPLGVSKLWHLPPLSSPPASSSSHPRNKCDWSCTTALKSAVSFLSANHSELVRTVRFWGIKKCSQAVSMSQQSTWGFCKDWIPKVITFWVTVLNCQRKTPQVLNPFIKLWAGFRSQQSPPCLPNHPLMPHHTQEVSDLVERLCTTCYMKTQISSLLFNSSEGLSPALWQRSNVFTKVFN